MEQNVTYADLRTGDVVFSYDAPAFLVLECDVETNAFRWFCPFEGTTGAPDFSRTQMWGELVGTTYDYVLRGKEYIKCSRIWTQL